MKYTRQEQVWYYLKRFGVHIIPLAVSLPLATWFAQPWIVGIIIPTIHCLDKFFREQGYYKNKLAIF